MNKFVIDMPSNVSGAAWIRGKVKLVDSRNPDWHCSWSKAWRLTSVHSIGVSALQQRLILFSSGTWICSKNVCMRQHTAIMMKHTGAHFCINLSADSHCFKISAPVVVVLSCAVLTRRAAQPRRTAFRALMASAL